MKVRGRVELVGRGNRRCQGRNREDQCVLDERDRSLTVRCVLKLFQCLGNVVVVLVRIVFVLVKVW